MLAAAGWLSDLAGGLSCLVASSFDCSAPSPFEGIGATGVQIELVLGKNGREKPVLLLKNLIYTNRTNMTKACNLLIKELAMARNLPEALKNGYFLRFLTATAVTN